MKEKPNIIFLLPDQLRYDFLSCSGADFIETPHMDTLCEKGIRYDRAYSTSPICVPARASLLTGMNAIKNGVTDNGQWLRPDLAQCGIKTWPEMLTDQGYYTAAIGKMHFYPWDLKHGFQYKVAAEDKRWPMVRDEYDHYLKENGYKKVHGSAHEGYFENQGAVVNNIPWEHSIDHFVGQEACRFIKNYGEEAPFAMMVGFPGPHCPYDPTEPFLKDFNPKDMPDSISEIEGEHIGLRQQNIDANKQPWNQIDYEKFEESNKKKIRAHYAALVKQIDYEVGKIRETLLEQGLADNTIIILSSDHGDYLGDHNFIGKQTFFESSIHVPLLVHIPWMEKNKSSSELVELGDITSTILHFSGSEIPAHMDSIPLPELGISDRKNREYSIGMTSKGWMIYDAEWKLMKYSTGEMMMYNLIDDPLEQHNLLNTSQHFEKYKELDSILTQKIQGFLTQSHHDKRVAADPLDPSFGKEGWNRSYPNTFKRKIE